MVEVLVYQAEPVTTQRHLRVRAMLKSRIILTQSRQGRKRTQRTQWVHTLRDFYILQHPSTRAPTGFICSKHRYLFCGKFLDIFIFRLFSTIISPIEGGVLFWGDTLFFVGGVDLMVNFPRDVAPLGFKQPPPPNIALSSTLVFQKI